MPESNIFQFKDQIRPFRNAFDQLCLTCAAIRIEGKWVSIYTCVAFSNSTDAGLFKSRTVTAGPEFVALFNSYPTDIFESLLQEVESGTLAITVEGEQFQVFLNRAAAGLNTQLTRTPSLQFCGVWRQRREWSEDQLTYRPRIQTLANGDRFYELLSVEDNQRISRQLRAQMPAYNGLDGLLRSMGSSSRPDAGSNEAVTVVEAILPFRTTVEEEHVIVQCPESLVSHLSVLFFFSPHESNNVQYAEASKITSGSNAIVKFPIPWPAAASDAEAHVRYDSEEVERISVRHWATGANWRVRLDQYFDPGSKLLKAALTDLARNSKEGKRSEAFEQAIVRLLNLGGIAAIWHGALRHSGKPDLAAYCGIPGRRIALLGECTLENPAAKLSTLKSRLSEARGLMADSADVLAVVFTACEPVESDYAEAAKAGIALLGRNEIANVQQLVERNAGAEAIIKQIENSITMHDSPMISRWQSRY